jgi:hypothetical protein
VGDRARARARLETQDEIHVLWESSSDLERRILKVVARRTVALGGREAERS